jgi:hypothetical protein
MTDGQPEPRRSAGVEKLIARSAADCTAAGGAALTSSASKLSSSPRPDRRDARQLGRVRRVAAGLRWADVDLNQRVIMIDQQRIAYGHTVTVGPPKTRAAGAPTRSGR